MQEVVDAAHRRKAAEKLASWDKFLEEIADGSAGMLHRISKPVQAWGEPEVCKNRHEDPQPLCRVEAKRADWAKVWRVDDPVQEEPRP
eukprot:9586054-Lingulodinium_polyedra.AAC.1